MRAGKTAVKAAVKAELAADADGSLRPESDVETLVRAVEKRFGLRLHVGFHTVLAERAFKMLGQHGATTLADVTRRLKDADDEDPLVVAMGQAASIGETYFFRSPKQLQLLEKLVMQHVVEPKRARNQKTLRIWSAACATGEEPYTLGMMFGKALPDFKLQILATDMNAISLQIAEEGVYKKRSFRGVNPETLPFLDPVGEGWQISTSLRKLVTFRELNLVHDTLPDLARGLANFDVVLCRNVLIYVDSNAIPVVMRKLSDCATSKALVALTPAESPAGRHLDGFASAGEGLWLREDARKGKAAPAPELAGSARPASLSPKGKPASATLSRSPAPLPSGMGQTMPVAPPEADAAERTLAKAREAADKGQLQEALRLAIAAQKRFPSAAEPCYLLGMVNAANGDKTQALKDFERALFLDRGFVAAELGLGEVLAREGRDAEARKHLLRARKLLSQRPAEQVVEGLQLPVALAVRLVEGALGGEE